MKYVSAVKTGFRPSLYDIISDTGICQKPKTKCVKEKKEKEKAGVQLHELSFFVVCLCRFRLVLTGDPLSAQLEIPGYSRSLFDKSTSNKTATLN